MENKDLRCLYETSVEMFKHFNSLVDKVRIIVVTVGVIVFASSGIFYLKEHTKWIPLISFWGLLFVLSMGFLARHYLMHTESIAEAAREVEEKLLNNSIANGAFKKIYADHHKKPVNKKPSNNNFGSLP